MPIIAGPATAGSNTASAETQRNVMINFKGSVSNLVNSTRSATSEISKLGAGVANVGKMFGSALTGNIKPLVNGIFNAVGKLASVFLTMPGFLLALVNPMNVAHMAMVNFSAAISAASPAEFVAATRNMAPAMQQAVMAVRLLEPQLKNLYGIIQQGFWAGFSVDVNNLAQTYFPVLGTGLGGIATMLGNLREQLVKFLLEPQVVSAIQSWMTAFTGLGTPILNMIEGLMPSLITLFTSFAQILTSLLPLVTDFANLLAKAVSFAAPLISDVAGIIGGVSSSLGGILGGGGTGSTGGTTGTGSSGGSSSSSGGGIGGFFSGLISGIGSFFSGLFGGGKATGGPVQAGMSYLVGERGPEILSMGQNGFVHPNSSAGGGHTFVNVKIGETELRGMISSEISKNDQRVAIAARMGRGQIV